MKNRPAEDVLQRAQENESRYVQDLKQLLQIPSVSSVGDGIEQCVSFLTGHLSAIGIPNTVHSTAGNPVIVADLPGRSPKTLLFYGHYDVQPPDPLDQWISPPFEAKEIDGRIYARGAVDDKGNFFCIIKAIQSFLETRGSLPCGIKMIIEGEEESGSPNLEPFFRQNSHRLCANDMVWFDGGIHADGRPEVCLGMKGLLYVELSVRVNPGDLHSGKAPLVENAAWRLVWALNSLFGPDGRVRIPGFYDGVLPPTGRDLDLIEASGLSEAHIVRDWGVERLRPGLEGRSGSDLLRRLFFEPTCNICGFTSGYGGPGSKTVIPSLASAKLDFRLVPGQDARDILQKLQAHLAASGFGDIEVRPDTFMPASKSPSDAEIVNLVMGVMRENYGEPTVKPIVEGSGPGAVFELLGVPYVFSRLGPPEDRSHAPNEYTTREAFRRGIATVIQLLEEYGGRISQD